MKYTNREERTLMKWMLIAPVAVAAILGSGTAAQADPSEPDRPWTYGSCVVTGVVDPSIDWIGPRVDIDGVVHGPQVSEDVMAHWPHYWEYTWACP